MKKLVLNATIVLGLLFIASCESTNLNDETGIENEIINKTDKGDSVNPGGGGNDPGDNDED